MLGSTIGPYRVTAELGSGGMGSVYLAEEGGRRLALKVVHPHLLATPGFFKRFLREGEIGKRVRHDNVVATLDIDGIDVEGKTVLYLAMEYVEGQTLRSLLEEMERVPEDLCRHIGREVARGLGAIHAAGVVHRDLKPENVLITADHVVKVMDLGVARLQDEALRLSQTGSFVGSIHYAAPECFTEGGRRVDHRADLHALGLILYELASGTNPYLADDVSQTVGRVLHEEPVRLGDLNPQISSFFEEVVHCLLAKRPEERFPGADTLAQVLEEAERSPWWTERARAIRAATRRPLRRARIPRETAVYGRDADLQRLRALYERAKQGAGQVVLIEGEAGIGKSRLVDEFVARLQREGENLNFLFGSYPPGGAATASGAFSTAYREQFGAEGCSGYLPHSPILVPAFDALLRGEPAPAGVEPLTKDSLQTCFVQATRALAAERPTVVLIDDLHFAPEEGRALFSMLAMAVPGHRALLVGTTRPGVPDDWLAGLTRLPQASQIVLGRLGPKDLALLLRDSFRSEHLATQLGHQIAMKSDGNPFFAFEIIHGLREGQFITQRDDGTWVSTRVIEEIQIPSSVLDLVNARVADLTSEEREALDVAACIGYEFDAVLVAEVAGRPRIALLRMLSHVERAYRLVRASGRLFLFDHHQVQEALYGSLPAMLREEYHAAIAGALETQYGAAARDPAMLGGALCVALCEHLLKGAQGARALRYLDPALAHLEKSHLHAQAVALAERPLETPGLLAGTARAAVLLRLASPHGSLDLLGRRAWQEKAAREAEGLAEEAGDEERRAQAARALGVALWRVSRHAEAEAAFRRALSIARARADRREEAAATGGLGLVFYAQGRLDEAAEHFERHLAINREIGDRQGEALVLGNLGNVLQSQGRLVEAKGHLERSLAICREVGNRKGEGTATVNLGIVLYSHGRLAEAREQFERYHAISREIGDREGEARVTGNLGGLLHSQDRLVEAMAYHERALAIHREIGDRRGEALVLGNMGLVFRSQGRLPEAREHFERALAIDREIGDRTFEGYALAGLAAVADEEGDPAGAWERATEALALRRDIGHAEVADSLIELGDLLRRAGELEAARAALAEAVTLARAQGRLPVVALALAVLACLPGEDVAAARAALAGAGGAGDTPRVHLLLWQATGDRAHLAHAKRLLDEALAKVPAACHAAMLDHVRVNREVAAAAKKAGL